MRIILRLCVICGIIYCIASFTGLMRDKVQLHDKVIRMHIVANSDSKEDQEVKLQVRDAILSYLQPVIEKFTDKEQAYQFVQDNLQKLEEVANLALRDLGEDKTATVSLTEEEFDIRKYDTFTLPSGCYDTLRVQIGEGEGKNWWCVTFPTLCLPSTTDAFADTAASSGFSDTLVETIAENEGYQIRFFFLDLLGRMENFFH